MTQYDFEKASVDITRLELEIKASQSITTVLLYSKFSKPSLSIMFDGDLTSEEETALGTIVTNHSGLPATTYTKWCCICGHIHDYVGIVESTTCDCCGSESCLYNTEDIAVAKAVVDTTTLKSPDGSSWIVSIDNEGVLITTKVVI